MAAGRLAEVLAAFCRYNLLQPLVGRPFLPRAMHLIATRRCNARCVMCGIWRWGEEAGEDLSLAEFQSLLGDPLFGRLRYVGISGGEPFLRNDLPDLAALFVDGCPDLRRLSLTTNGLLPERLGAMLPPLAAAARRKGVLLDVSVSVHATGDLHGRIFGLPGTWERVRRSLDLLAAARARGELSVSLNAVLLAGTVDSAPALRDWAAGAGFPISFVVGEVRERFANEEAAAHMPGPAQRERLAAFLRRMGEDASSANLSAYRYRELADLVEGRGERTSSCYYAFTGFLLGHDGRLYYCSHSKAVGDCRTRAPHEIFYDPANLAYRRDLLGSRCRNCPPYTRTRLELAKDLHRVAATVIKSLWRAHPGHPA